MDLLITDPYELAKQLVDLRAKVYEVLQRLAALESKVN